MIRKLFNIYIFAALMLAFVSIANAQGARHSAEDRGQISSVKNSSTRANAGGIVSPANQQAFQVGKNFATAIYDSTFLADREYFDYTIVDLVYLIDSLEGQPEAAQLQAILKGMVRGTKDATVSGEIAVISGLYQVCQNAEKKWYFNVGNTQMNVMLLGWSSDSVGVGKAIKELLALTKTAPVGTPQVVLTAIRDLAKYSAMAKLTKDDMNAIANDAKIITNIVYA